jgi:hypothetical protein
MSLINDALRRATNQDNKRDPNELPAMQPTFRPVRTGGPGFSIFVVCFLLAAALTLGAWFYYKRSIAAGKATPAPAAATVNTNNNPLARAANTLGAVDNLNKEGVSAAESMQSATPAVAANPTPAIGTPTAPSAVAATAGGPKLQGIFYSANNASVIINGKSMKVGDEANGIKVVSIAQKSVTIESGGQRRELTMK